MIIKLLTEHHLEFLAEKETEEVRPSLHMSNATLLEITCTGSNNTYFQEVEFTLFIVWLYFIVYKRHINNIYPR